jgi:predicted metal-dependent HD superfamily phosphohydrolase
MPWHTRDVSGPIEPELIATPSRLAPSPLVDAWQRHVADDLTLLKQLIRRHREKHRRYHTVDHVVAVVAAVEDLGAADGARDLGAVVAAAFYHDAVYEPASPSNERASARLARRDLTTLGWVADRTAHVADVIEATADHRSAPDTDHALLSDADLAILAAPPDEYAAYVGAVRAEYHHVDDAAWRAGRRTILDRFLERDWIYATPTGRTRWEHAARANLTTEVKLLNG